MRCDRGLALLAGLLLMWPVSVHALDKAGGLGIGRVPTPEEIAAWDIDARPDGLGLPAGKGGVAEGERVFAQRCEGCHQNGGEKAAVASLDILVGGNGTLDTAKPLRTIGSYWPFATTLFDYIRRAMPFDAPQSLSADEVYALSAYLLNRNGIVPVDAVLDATMLAQIRMPNRDGFIDRDDWRSPPQKPR